MRLPPRRARNVPYVDVHVAGPLLSSLDLSPLDLSLLDLPSPFSTSPLSTPLSRSAIPWRRGLTYDAMRVQAAGGIGTAFTPNCVVASSPDTPAPSANTRGHRSQPLRHAPSGSTHSSQHGAQHGSQQKAASASTTVPRPLAGVFWASASHGSDHLLLNRAQAQLCALRDDTLAWRDECRRASFRALRHHPCFHRTNLEVWIGLAVCACVGLLTTRAACTPQCLRAVYRDTRNNVGEDMGLVKSLLARVESYVLVSLAWETQSSVCAFGCGG